MEHVDSTLKKKSYLEAALTPPMISPNMSPLNPFLTKHDLKVGLIDTRLKWYNNKVNKEEICSICKKGILEDEWNSYYNVFVMRYKDYKDDHKLKIFNDKDVHDDSIYCDKCKKDLCEKFSNSSMIQPMIQPIMPSLVLG